MSEIVGVKFRNTGKIYYFAPNGMTFVKGDGVIVETAHGMEYATVALDNREVPDENLKELKPISRKAGDDDVKRYEENLAKRPSALRLAQDMANRRKLEMKFVDVEFTFDGTKVVFYFTSEHRIDFRELVKELAANFHMRIELRQIGIRDECKLKGGLGPCGRVCCCNSYMDDFERVSIKMAKHQGLSLNPGKISGLCGRLMCCLKFEDEYYADTLKFMPKLNSEIDTPKGRGKVESVDVLRQTVVVRRGNENDGFEYYEFTLPELGITPVYPNRCANCPNADTDTDGEDDTDLIPTEEEQ